MSLLFTGRAVRSALLFLQAEGKVRRSAATLNEIHIMYFSKQSRANLNKVL
jgi:hypothetical protein